MPFVCSYQCRFMTRTYSGGFWFRGVSGFFFFFFWDSNLGIKLPVLVCPVSPCFLWLVLPFIFSLFFNLFGKLDSDCDIVFLTSWPRHIYGVRTIYTNRWPYSPATDISTTWCRTSETRHCSVYSSTVDYSATGPYTAGSATTVHRKSSVPNTTVLREYNRNKTRVSTNLGNRSLGGEDPLKLSPSSLRVAVPSRPRWNGSEVVSPPFHLSGRGGTATHGLALLPLKL